MLIIPSRTKISYLIALFNKEKYIIEAVESILLESSENIEIEVCIVDDGSTDESAKIVACKYGNNPQVKLIYFDKNKGKNAAYNKAYSVSKGEYISLMGADDVIVPGRTKLLLDKVRTYGKATYGTYIKIFENNSNKEEDCYLPKKITFDKNIIFNQLPGGCFMMHRQSAKKIFPIPENLQFEDWWISFNLLRDEGVHTIKESVLYYRIHSQNDWNNLEGGSKVQLTKHFLRDYPYLEMFRPLLRTRMEIFCLQRALAIRDCYLYRSQYLQLLKPPYNRSWISLLAANFLRTKKIIKL